MPPTTRQSQIRHGTLGGEQEDHDRLPEKHGRRLTKHRTTSPRSPSPLKRREAKAAKRSRFGPPQQRRGKNRAPQEPSADHSLRNTNEPQQPEAATPASDNRHALHGPPSPPSGVATPTSTTHKGAATPLEPPVPHPWRSWTNCRDPRTVAPRSGAAAPTSLPPTPRAAQTEPTSRRPSGLDRRPNDIKAWLHHIEPAPGCNPRPPPRLPPPQIREKNHRPGPLSRHPPTSTTKSLAPASAASPFPNPATDQGRTPPTQPARAGVYQPEAGAKPPAP
jgi:hypothetical protein